ncbi:MAG: ABC transporter ATP-binding protein [Chthoniobacterales bacterium]|nr:ABC transporter ATP-binding protein [Chthoniobacterales bacterium]
MNADAAFLEVRNLAKAFKHEPVLRRVSLALQAHQTLSVLGRSGCGKTTLLKIIAGLVEPDAGDLYLEGARLNEIAPQRRNIVYLYQEALLFSHLNVFENIAFGLRLRKVPNETVKTKVGEMLESLELGAHRRKRPEQLSGGQRQRVAFGRALIISPALMLLDEPFSNLDAEIRTSMQQLFKQVARRFSITSIFVTHDLKEALIMGDRMAQMSAGELRSFASKEEFVHDPATGVATELGFWDALKAEHIVL